MPLDGDFIQSTVVDEFEPFGFEAGALTVHSETQTGITALGQAVQTCHLCGPNVLQPLVKDHELEAARGTTADSQRVRCAHNHRRRIRLSPVAVKGRL